LHLLYCFCSVFKTSFYFLQIYLKGACFLLSESEFIYLRLVFGNCSIIKFKPVILIISSFIRKLWIGILFFKWYPKAIPFTLFYVFCFDFCNIVMRFVWEIERLGLNAEFKMNWSKIIADWRLIKNLSFNTFIIFTILTIWIIAGCIIRISNKSVRYLKSRNQAY